MPARTLPGLALEAFFALGENGWNDEFDMNMLKLSVLVQGGVISRIAPLPGAPADGDIYILTTDNKVNVRDDGAWIEFTPSEGWLLYDKDAGVYVSYDGAAWVELETAGGGGGGGGGTVDGTLYRFGGFFTGTPAADEILLLHVASDDFTIPLNFGTTETYVGTNPAADTDFDIQVNGASIGTMTVATTGVVTFTAPETEIVSGDVIEIIAPAVADGTIANVAFTFRAGIAGAVGGASPWENLYLWNGDTDPDDGADIILDVTDYSEVEIMFAEIVTAGSSARFIRLSTDGGVTYDDATTNYKAGVADTGGHAFNDNAAYQNGNSGGPSTMYWSIKGTNLPGPHWIQSNRPTMHMGLLPITHILVSSGLSNRTAGHVVARGRK